MYRRLCWASVRYKSILSSWKRNEAIEVCFSIGPTLILWSFERKKNYVLQMRNKSKKTVTSQWPESERARKRERKGTILPDFIGSLSNIISAITNLIPNKNIKFLNSIIPSSNKVYAHSIFCCLFPGPNILTELFLKLFKCNQKMCWFFFNKLRMEHWMQSS